MVEVSSQDSEGDGEVEDKQIGRCIYTAGQTWELLNECCVAARRLHGNGPVFLLVCWQIRLSRKLRISFGSMIFKVDGFRKYGSRTTGVASLHASTSYQC